MSQINTILNYTRQAVIQVNKQYRILLEIMEEINLREIAKQNPLKPERDQGRLRQQQSEDKQQRQITNFFNLNR